MYLWNIKKYNKLHKIILIDSLYLKCLEHDKNYFGYCEICKINISNYCNEHEKHSIILLNKFFKTFNLSYTSKTLKKKE